ncbi:MAG: vWA domain-containing protein, partial [Actinomycetota bacterium]|nr:vWA domain-containing protein [Actinomycetota bacterium]
MTLFVFALTAVAVLMVWPAQAREMLRVRTVDTSRYPAVKLQLGLTTRDKAAGFKLWENGHEVKGLKVGSNISKEPMAVTLLIDVSGSMKDKPLADAKAAAKLFVDRAKPSDRVSIVAFSSTVNRPANFTNDKARLNSSIDGLQAGGETAVYDGLLEALNGGRGQNGYNKSIILLSDGGDTASKASVQSVKDTATRLKIPISAIALQSSEFNAAPLTEVAQASGGQLITALSSAGLISLYDGLAAELHNRY